MSNEQPADCQVLVVGAGPAGLFAALSLTLAGIDVTIVDAGPDIDERRRSASFFRTFGHGYPDYESGVGGAGLFSDGKLCLSLEVGGRLETQPADQRQWLLGQIRGVFDQLIEGGFDQRDVSGLDRIEDEAGRSGLRFKYYPVAHIGTDRCGDVIVKLRQALLDAGVNLLPETKLVELGDREGGMVATVNQADGEAQINADHIILAMGKVGADRQASICRSLGTTLHSQPIYVGVRFETSAEQLAPLFEATKDPKYSIELGDGSKVKTHCASEHGEVIELRYADLPLAGGHNYSHAMTMRSGFSVLWDGLPIDGSSYGAALELMRRADRISGGRLLAQRLCDYRDERPSETEALRALPLSCRSALGGDLRAVLPREFFAAMELLLERLDHLAPGFIDQSAVMYGPAIEWWMERIGVEGTSMRTSVPGLSVCGDGSGWSQGIVHAAATGLLAAEGIHGQQIDVANQVAASGLSALISA